MKWMKATDVIEGNTENFENCIYMWRNQVNQKLYIGQAKDFRKRTRDHKYESFNENKKYHYNVPFHCAIRKYGIENFEVCILEKDLNDYDEMDEKEIYYIKFYDTLANNKKGYNVASGGGNSNPYAGKIEEEMKEIGRKKSENHANVSGKNNPMYGRTGEKHPKYGKHHSEETKKKQSEAHKGKQFSKEHKQKISEAKKNMSEETRQKISEAKKGKNNPKAKKVILLNTGEIFNTIKEAEEKYEVTNISANCRGRLRSAGKDENGNKLVWMYLEDY